MQSTMTRTFLMLLLFQLFLISCGNESPAADTKKELPKQENTTLPNTIDQAVATTHIQYFKTTPLDSLSKIFYRGEKMNNLDKVLTFGLNSAQVSSFFDRYEILEKDGAQKIFLRIHMALNVASDSEVVIDKPNVVPLLEFVVDQKPDSTYYPVRSLFSPFLQQFDQLYGWQDTLGCPDVLGCGDELLQIGAKCVQELVNNWSTTPITDINKQLYVDEKTDSIQYRIKHYTFNEKDTKALYAFQKLMKEEKKLCYFYVHFGRLVEGPDCVPLRTILHLDDNPIDVNVPVNRANDHLAYFEFAKPCPPYCKPPKKESEQGK